MALLRPLNDYYKITLHFTGTGGGGWDYVVALTNLGTGASAGMENFNGDGTEFGGSIVSGTDQITAVAQGIADAIAATSAPYWGTGSVVSVEAQPTQLVTLA